MALLETDFAGAIEEFAAQWQKSFGENDHGHDHGDWEDVRVLERVCWNHDKMLCVSGQRMTK